MFATASSKGQASDDDRGKNGRAAIEWGVYGVLETFAIGRKIAYKLVGPITPDNLEGVVKHQIEKALTAG